MTLLVAVIRAKQNETDYFLNPGFNNCQRKSLNLLLCNTDCCRNFLSLVPSRTDVFGGKAAVDLKSIPDRRSSPSRAAVTRAARRRSKEGGGAPPSLDLVWGLVHFYKQKLDPEGRRGRGGRGFPS